MRNWKNWLAPLISCLAVVGLAVLPLRLSLLGDRTLSGAVHAEELGENSNFPARPLELPERLWLLAQLEAWPDALTEVSQDLEERELEELLEELRTELEALEAAGALPEGTAGHFESFYGSRVYLRDRTDLSSAGFLELTSYSPKPEEYLRLYLDRETGRAAALELESRLPWKMGLDPETAGAALLDRLGVPYEADGQSTDWMASFRLTESRVLYRVWLAKEHLLIVPQVDWTALEEEDGVLFDIAQGLA